MKSKLFQQIYKYVLVGIINTAIDLAVLNFLIFLTHRGKNGIYYAVFKGISFLFAVANSYFLNKKWTFAGAGSKNKKAKHEAIQYLVVSGVGFAVNVFVAVLFVHLVPPLFGLVNLWPTIGALAGTLGGLAWNFIGYRYVVFKDEKPELLPPA